MGGTSRAPMGKTCCAGTQGRLSAAVKELM